MFQQLPERLESSGDVIFELVLNKEMVEFSGFGRDYWIGTFRAIMRIKMPICLDQHLGFFCDLGRMLFCGSCEFEMFLAPLLKDHVVILKGRILIHLPPI